jgi:hypothetical protein
MVNVKGVIQTTNKLPAKDLGYKNLHYTTTAIDNAKNSLIDKLVFDNIKSKHSLNGNITPPTPDFNKKVGKVISTNFDADKLMFDIELFDNSYEKLLKSYPIGFSSEVSVNKAHVDGEDLIVDDFEYTGVVIADKDVIRDGAAIPLINNTISENAIIIEDNSNDDSSDNNDNIQNQKNIDDNNPLKVLEELVSKRLKGYIKQYINDKLNNGDSMGENNSEEKEINSNEGEEKSPITLKNFDEVFKNALEKIDFKSIMQTEFDTVLSEKLASLTNTISEEISSKVDEKFDEKIESITNTIPEDTQKKLIEEITNSVKEDFTKEIKEVNDKIDKIPVNKYGDILNTGGSELKDSSLWVTRDDDHDTQVKKLNEFYKK